MLRNRVTNRVMLISGLFPSLRRRGGRAIKKMVPFQKGADGVVVHKSGFRMPSELQYVSDHPVCGASVGFASFLLMPQPPLLIEEGNNARPPTAFGKTWTL